MFEKSLLDNSMRKIWMVLKISKSPHFFWFSLLMILTSYVWEKFDRQYHAQNLNGLENIWLCMKLWKLPLCAPQQSDLGIGGGRFITAMLYLSDVEVGPLQVEITKRYNPSEIQTHAHPLSSSYVATETGKYLFNPFEGRRTDNLPQAGNFSQAGSW